MATTRDLAAWPCVPWRRARTRSRTSSSSADDQRRRRDRRRRAPAWRGADRAGKHADADQEGLLLPEDAGAVEHVLVGIGLGERRGEARSASDLARRQRSRRRPARSARRGHATRWMTISARRGAVPMIVASRSSRPGLRAEEREELDAGRHARQEAVEGGEGGVGVVGPRQRLEQRRRDLGQPLARRGRAHRRVAAEMPAADRRASPRDGLAKPSRDERRERLRIVGVAGEDQAAERRR